MTGSSESYAAPVSTEDGSRQMGATVTAHRAGYTKASFMRYVDLGTFITGADVNVGVLNELNGRGSLIAASVALRATVQPPAVYLADAEGILRSIEPETPDWLQASSLVDGLVNSEDRLGGRQTAKVAAPLASHA